jgi:hypothetical protein
MTSSLELRSASVWTCLVVMLNQYAMVSSWVCEQALCLDSTVCR